MVAASSFGIILVLIILPVRVTVSKSILPQTRNLEIVGDDTTRRRTKKSDRSKGKGGKKTSEGGKGRSQTSQKNSREKGKGSGGKGRRGDFCSSLTFSQFNSSDVMANIFSGVVWKGNGKGRRILQVGDHSCSQNGLEIMRGAPNLSIFVDLLEFANLEEIFSCAVRIDLPKFVQESLTTVGTVRDLSQYWHHPTSHLTKIQIS